MNIVLIGLTGPAGAGKTTLAKHLVERQEFFEVAFADPLKDMIAALFDVDREELEARYLSAEAKEQPVAGIGMSPRYLLQTLGTEWGRQLVHPDLWVMALHRRLAWMENHLAEGQRNVVVSDVRFENEAAMIRNAGGTVIRVKRPGIKRLNHQSEDGVFPAAGDYYLDNAGSIEDATRELDRIVIAFLKKRAGATRAA